MTFMSIQETPLKSFSSYNDTHAESSSSCVIQSLYSIQRGLVSRMPAANQSQQPAIVLARLPESETVQEMPPVSQAACLVVWESASSPNAYANTLNPNLELCCFKVSRFNSEIPSVKNRIAFKHPDVLRPTCFEIWKISYALSKAPLKFVPPEAYKLLI